MSTTRTVVSRGLIISSAQVAMVIKVLANIGNRVAGQFHGQLVVGRYYEPEDYPIPGFSYYFLAERVRGKLLGFIPRMRKRVLVAMNDPHRDYGDEVGCTVLDGNISSITEEEVRSHAQAVNATKVTILNDNKPLVI